MLDIIHRIIRRSLARQVISYYVKMKKYESLFRDAKIKLINTQFEDGKTIVTRLGNISFQETRKAVVDMEKVKKLLSYEQLIKLATINTNALLRELGTNNFNSVISGYKTTRQIIIK